MFETIKNNPQNTFYPVKLEAIHKAEIDMGVIIPEVLKDFYLNVGYGFLETHRHNINRIMGPVSVEEFYLGTGQFQNLEEAEIFQDYMKDKLVFFEVNESLYLSIGTTKVNKGKVYYYNDVIANDLNEFFEKYLENEKYFLD